MSAARIIPFPVNAHSRHEISGPRPGVIAPPEEREPSPGSAWPWTIFTGAGGVLVDLEPNNFEEPVGHDKEAAERLKATLEAPCNYVRWLRLDAWTLQQAVCIIGGIDPDSALGTMNCFLNKNKELDTPGKFDVFRSCSMFILSLRPMLLEMRGSHFAGKLKTLGPWLEDLTMVDPSEAIRWAASKGYDIPPALAAPQGGGAEAEERVVRENANSPQDLASRLKALGLEGEKIAAILKADYPNISEADIGGLLPANPGAEVSYSARQSRGRRLLGKK